MTLAELFGRAQPLVDEGLRKIRDKERDPRARENIRQTPMLHALPALEQAPIFRPAR